MRMLFVIMISLLAVVVLTNTGCTKGPQGAQGIPGPQGPSGNTGATGISGAAGTNGTVITIIQFCPGVETYPSVFPEVGLCINNKIYAVYSKNDGFLTEVVPGAYNSNAVGSNCNFTVLPNCVIN